ncbi:MAG: BofC C-terminal domain-containing protein [Lachnospiraceae bacterium]|nr:BofC C-terminal domain-containing protein [Lachnospiraceae bacterium]
MNQTVKYIILGLAVLALILGINLISYRMTIGEVEEMQNDYENRVSEQVEVQVTKAMERERALAFEDSVTDEDTEDVLKEQDTSLDIDTIYQIQNYDAVKDTTETEDDHRPEDFVGFTRKDMDDYCKEYMESVPAEEYLLGLQSMGVVSFSKERLVVKKIYDGSKVKYRYYLIAVEGEVVIYYGDKKTVYEYTGIETERLSKEEQNKLKRGIEIRDENELYSVLENYSS